MLRILATLAVLTVAATGQVVVGTTVQVNAWNVPYTTSAVSNGSNTVNCPTGVATPPAYVASVNAVVIPIEGACIDRTPLNGEVGPYYPSAYYTWGNFDTLVNAYLASAAHVNFVVRHIQNPPAMGVTTGNSYTPAYVFTQAWADQVAPQWSSGASFYAQQYVTVQITGTTYYFFTTTNCTTGTATPMWVAGHTGIIDNSCSWNDTGTSHAPPQHVAFCGTNNGVNYNYSGNPLAAGVWNRSSATLAEVQQGLPAIWEQAYATWYNQFTAQVLQHLAASSYAGKIGYVRFGVSMGGEASTNCMSTLVLIFQASLQTNAQMKTVWTGFATSSYATNASQALATVPRPRFLLQAAVNCGTGLPTGGADCSWADLEAAAAASQPGYAIGSEGMQVGDLSSNITGQPCSNDSCNWHNTWCGKVPFIQYQSVSVSTPLGGSPLMGSLNQVLPFATQHCTSVIELYDGDLACIYSGTGTGCSAVQASYQSAVQNAAMGQPSGATSLTGNASTAAGKSAIY
jgi:hypothetical protein